MAYTRCTEDTDMDSPEGVNFLQVGTEGHAVQTRQLGGEQTALQTGVDGLHLGGRSHTGR